MSVATIASGFIDNIPGGKTKSKAFSLTGKARKYFADRSKANADVVIKSATIVGKFAKSATVKR
ncbi:MAG: hypothetical protein ACR2OC_11915 [Solirubrobacterales bacterium]